jgi:peptidoglycan/xylan/chitin deacetylase (PgdA/CDA1 family)
MYHEVVDDPNESGFQRPSAMRYKHQTADFVRDLDIIAKKKALIRLVTDVDTTKPGNYIFLTFDDGGKSTMRTAAFLAQRGLKGHFFIPTSKIDDPLFLSKTAVRELHQQGHIIGSHSHTHPANFTVLTLDQMHDEWHRSVAILSDIIGGQIITGSIPSGFSCSNTIATAGRAGIKYLFTSEIRTKPWWHENVLCFGRVCPQRHTPAKKIRLYADFKGITRERFICQTKQVIKWLISPVYKRYVK